MKKKMMLIIASVITIVLLSVGCNLNGNDSNDTVTYNLREEGPAGGWVFYDKGSYSDGWRYMEAWTADESGTYAWKDQNTATSGTDTAIGTGYANTYTAMAGSNHPAAEAVREATYGGKNDWFVPSIYELEKIYENLYNGGENVGNFTLGGPEYSYWSSSQYIDKSAYAMRIQGGSTGTAAEKINTYYVRAVRRF